MNAAWDEARRRDRRARRADGRPDRERRRRHPEVQRRRDLVEQGDQRVHHRAGRPAVPADGARGAGRATPPQAPPATAAGSDGGSSGSVRSWWWLLGIVPVVRADRGGDGGGSAEPASRDDDRATAGRVRRRLRRRRLRRRRVRADRRRRDATAIGRAARRGWAMPADEHGDLARAGPRRARPTVIVADLSADQDADRHGPTPIVSASRTTNRTRRGSPTSTSRIRVVDG